MPLKPHPTDPDKMVYVSRQYDIPQPQGIPQLQGVTTAQPAQEPVAFAGIEIWVGNARIAKYLTQTELHYAQDPWMLMQYSAEMCISKLKDKNNG